MVGDEPGDPLAFGVGELERAAQPLGDPGAGLLVVVEGVAAPVQHPGGRLADVVQERGEGQREAGIRRQEIEHQHRVVPEVALGLHRLALEQPLHRHQRGQDRRRRGPVSRARFMAWTRLACTSIRRSSWAIRSAETLMTCPAMARRAARVAGSIWSWNRAASRMARRQRSLSSRSRAAGSPMARRMLVLQVRLAPDVVDHFAGERVHEHSVDREVAAGGVELGRAEDDRFGPPAVDIGAVAAESRDLDLDAGATVVAHPHDAERDPDRDRAVGQARP